MERLESEVWFDDGDEDEDGYDAIVVGSRYGGSVASCRMSVVGIKVCLVEKGRRWESKDFPTDGLKIMSAVYEQDDSLAAVACGLGGGLLVNRSDASNSNSCKTESQMAERIGERLGDL
ncbi:Cholesterol oxidase [Actinidia chinensis var. chinensis]|uniref:Cholesterol oxidase n=1 Tax=Actinidia chinensis var. chinensis TaxID=1590841 RepID=A0A2R6PBK6_ACTCC|nr:Cholesterol oxidase [Actinidia chinensis var. chinensis]